MARPGLYHHQARGDRDSHSSTAFTGLGERRPETQVIFVGYQAAGTLGRRLVNGARRVRIFGETIAVRAAIHTLGGFSAHAGQSELVQWLTPMARDRPKVILTHGEERGRVPLAQCIADRFGISAELPLREDIVANGD
jgi:metallo-beta-lactamase family protein